MPLVELPWEVLDLIGSFCGQADVISLAIACPAIADAVLPGIYRCIVIDAAPRSLQTERPSRLIAGRLIPCTVVHTIAGIKQCLDALAQRPRFGAEVRSFVCNGNIGMSDNALLPRVELALSNLRQLVELSWTACPELPPSALARIAPHADRAGTLQCSNLRVLSVDLAVRTSDAYPTMEFPQLRTLRVRPFLDASVLRWIGSIARSSRELEDIELCRFLDSKSEVGSSYRFVGLSDVQQYRLKPAPAVSEFFGHVGTAAASAAASASAVSTTAAVVCARPCPRPRWQLKRLALLQTDTAATDWQHLSHTSDLRDLCELKLTGSGHEDEANHRLAARIASIGPRLTKLTLDWRMTFAALSGLISRCCTQLQSLTIHVREIPPRPTLEMIADTCGPSLRQLSLQLDPSLSMADFEPLERLRNLEVLKIPFSHAVNSWEIVPHLPALAVVELTLSNASSSAASRTSLSSSHAPNLGLLTSGILDAWNDRLPSPLQYANILAVMRKHANLRYVVIDGHVTCLRHESPPLSSFSI